MGAMNRTLLVALGVIATVISSFVGLVMLPQAQLAALGPLTMDDGTVYPVEPFGAIEKGRDVYIDLGCIYCHSQQVRPEGFGADIERGWGQRHTVPRDYLYADPILLGSMRTGPDLANIAARQPSADWHYLHLYDPEITSPGSIMPRFPFLFDRVPRDFPEPPNALDLPPSHAEPDHWVVPNERGRHLVAYLLSLDRNHPVPEVSRDE
jgi:cytochrome c oxidase cbb3-type subunit 2